MGRPRPPALVGAARRVGQLERPSLPSCSLVAPSMLNGRRPWEETVALRLRLAFGPLEGRRPSSLAGQILGLSRADRKWRPPCRLQLFRVAGPPARCRERS